MNCINFFFSEKRQLTWQVIYAKKVKGKCYGSLNRYENAGILHDSSTSEHFTLRTTLSECVVVLNNPLRGFSPYILSYINVRTPSVLGVGGRDLQVLG